MGVVSITAVCAYLRNGLNGLQLEWRGRYHRGPCPLHIHCWLRLWEVDIDMIQQGARVCSGLGGHLLESSDFQQLNDPCGVLWYVTVGCC